ncbi:deoxyribodipyrimidine photo-lyase [Siphonobacter sp. SORGH_AS_1065]|uniref:cryptochrome/photolyase family protein n=1 Tax=Siphonobacter sp. SORGH_AS_1065 TaxID=3041795 RepID=UPI002784F60E|nr:deoxyribodipyrimidine photo-lyase [Siphonobacter sp. SORGH_AS_1065]MDQ1086592.1 deoxyribodipyrimidine photo-lyase [Siphonobacter sp. SORGH_AS_1065]
MEKISICWLRRDLRLHDQAALYHALRGAYPVLVFFIFDREILDDLEDRRDRRVEFIYEQILSLDKKLQKHKSGLLVKYGSALPVWKEVLKEYDIAEVYTNNDYEQYALERDKAVADLLATKQIPLHSFKDQVIFEKDEVLSKAGKPYSVFTPYSKAWKAKVNDFYVKSYPTEKYFKNFFKAKLPAIPSLQDMNFEAVGEPFPSSEINEELIKDYDKTRDFPNLEGTSRMSIHLRFGTVSIRDLVRVAQKLNATYLNELMWRDFYFQVLYHFPHINSGHAFRPEYDRIQWRNDEQDFEAWCEGQTGYPIVDAGMRQMNATGFMHNRVRMITASFLAKHLLIDWRWGEAYFAKKLLDYDFSANNGGWQWAAGSGCDASPYFRVFNPALQAKKFDAKQEYVRHWVPEVSEAHYPDPIVEHETARERAITTYRKAVKKK